MQRLLATDRQAYYAPAPGGGTGHLIFLRGTTLMAQPFDPNKIDSNQMGLSGEPVAIADGVDSFSTTNHGLFSVSDTGTLVYRGGSGPQTMLTWFDQQGNPAGTLGDPGDYSYPAISPDGSRVAVAMGAAGQPRHLDSGCGARHQHALHLRSRQRRLSRLVARRQEHRVQLQSRTGQITDLYIKPADGSGEEKLLLKTDEPKTVERWTKDGRFLLFGSTGPKTAWTCGPCRFRPGPSRFPSCRPGFRKAMARVSPDGRWLAYTSNESGTFEIYVRPFTPEAPAGTGAKWLVSKGGGVRSHLAAGWQGVVLPHCDRPGDGRGYRHQQGIPGRYAAANVHRSGGRADCGWDLSPDGKRFLFVAPPNTGRVIPFTVVVNWAAGLKKCNGPPNEAHGRPGPRLSRTGK